MKNIGVKVLLTNRREVKLEINETKKKRQINSVGWQHTRVYNNKTNKAKASRFCSTASHHSNKQSPGQSLLQHSIPSLQQTKPRPAASEAPHPITLTNKVKASRFCSTASHHSNKQSPGQSPSLQRTRGVKKKERDRNKNRNKKRGGGGWWWWYFFGPI